MKTLEDLGYKLISNKNKILYYEKDNTNITINFDIDAVMKLSEYSTERLTLEEVAAISLIIKTNCVFPQENIQNTYSKESILDVVELAEYIYTKYKSKYNKIINPIMLHKALYFCFAYWAELTCIEHNKTEMDFDDNIFNKILFNAEFEAWVYGAAIPLIKDKFDTLQPRPAFPHNSELLKDYIDDTIDTIFETNLFSLIQTAREDKCWQNNYENIIPIEEIIEEYKHY